MLSTRKPLFHALLAALVLAILLALGSGGDRSLSAVPVAHTTRGPAVGVISGAADFGGSAIRGRLRQVLSRTRVKWVREGFFWSTVEPRRGVFHFAHYDHFMVLAARRHVHVLALLYQAPGWAAPAPNAVPRNPAAYAEFVAAVVHRYGPGGRFWRHHHRLRHYAISTFDLWNEPYYDIGNAGHYDPARYARLVRKAVQAGRAANPAAKFLMGAEMQGTLVGSKWRWWVDAMYRAVPQLNRYFDGVAVHPYGHDITHRSPAIVGRQYYGYDQMRRIEVIRQQFVRQGAADKPMWVTEVGWPTCRTGSIRCVTLKGQAASFRALMRYAQTIWSSYVRAVFVYYYDDQPAAPSQAFEADYGLTHVNHRPKPILGVFRWFAHRAPVRVWP